jgi:hypothetical protein
MPNKPSAQAFSWADMKQQVHFRWRQASIHSFRNPQTLCRVEDFTDINLLLSAVRAGKARDQEQQAAMSEIESSAATMNFAALVQKWRPAGYLGRLHSQSNPTTPDSSARTHGSEQSVLCSTVTDSGSSFCRHRRESCRPCLHAVTFDADTKKPKQTARRMMQMVRDINAADFDGKPVLPVIPAIEVACCPRACPASGASASPTRNNVLLTPECRRGIVV